MKRRKFLGLVAGASTAALLTASRKDALGKKLFQPTTLDSTEMADFSGVQLGILVLQSSGTTVALTGTTALTTMTSLTVPAGLMTPNALMEARYIFRAPASNSGTVALAFILGGTTLFSQTLIATDHKSHEVTLLIFNRNSTQSQYAVYVDCQSQNEAGSVQANTPVVGATTASAVDTTTSQILKLTAQLSVAGDTFNLREVGVSLVNA